MRWVDKLFLCLHKAFQEGMQSILPIALWNDFSLSWSKGQNYTSLDLVWLYLQEIDLFSSSSSLYIEFSLSFYCCHMKSFCNLCHSIFYSSIPNNLASPANLATSDYCLFCILMMNKIGLTVDPDGQPVVNIIMKIALFFPSIFYFMQLLIFKIIPWWFTSSGALGEWPFQKPFWKFSANYIPGPSASII